MNNGLSANSSSLGNASNQVADSAHINATEKLPQTGVSVKKELAMGSIVLAGSLAAAFLNRKKD